MSPQPNARPQAARFTDASLRSQAAFRAIMRAMAQPGRIETIPGRGGAPAPLAPAGAEALVTLCDFETSLWIAPDLAASAQWLRFETGARIAAAQMDAAFALCAAKDLDLSQFSIGTAAYPDRGATIVVQCPALEGGPSLTLAGPGIAATSDFAVAGLPEGFADQSRANHARFPLGVDLVLVSGERLLALPRSTRILEAR
jgi:alpha-D-ribose 1-methylphosphonate 5-triphosphate synthase subunit PhnH